MNVNATTLQKKKSKKSKVYVQNKKDMMKPSIDYTDDKLSLVASGLKEQPLRIKIIPIM